MEEKTTYLNKIPMYVGLALCLFMLVTEIVFTVRLFRMEILTIPYKVDIIVVMVFLTAAFAVLQKWLVPGIITKIFAVAIGVVMIIGCRYLGATTKALDKMTSVKTQIDNVCVYVLKESQYNDIEDLKDAEFGIAANLDAENTRKAVDMIEGEIGQPIVTEEYANAIELIQALYDKKTDAVILNSSFMVFFEDVEGYSDVEEKIKSIWSADIETEIADTGNNENNNSSNNDVIEEPTGDPYEDYKDYLYGGSDVFTLYVSGIDTTGSPMVNRNSDVNILISVNTKTRQILMISTPRDFYVPLSISNGVKDKLTHAGCYGIQVSVDTLEMLYGVNIDNYLKVNFTGFVNVIDQLGGVNVYSEYDFKSVTGAEFVKGNNYLDGKQALAFARERKAFPSGDRQRGKNQMAVIKAIIEKCTTSDALLNYENILDAVSSSIATSMSSEQITDLIKMQLSDMSGWNIVTYSADGTGASEVTYSIPTPKYVMVPNMDTVNQAKEYLRQIYSGEVLTQ